MKANPISEYMTPLPFTIGEEIPLLQAKELMDRHHIRHLPVQNRGKLVGILSDRDAKVGIFRDSGLPWVRVEDVMTEETYAVTPETPLVEVLAEMDRKKYGCVVVQHEDGRTLGIFTATDAVHLLETMFRQGA